jgi:hypothetical protein
VREVVEAGTNNSLGACRGICFERDIVAGSHMTIAQFLEPVLAYLDIPIWTFFALGKRIST